MPNPRKGNLSVPVGEELLDRINTVAKALNKSQAEFVRETMDERTRQHQEESDAIAEKEAVIRNRERDRSNAL
jgi:hypothetical protein